MGDFCMNFQGFVDRLKGGGDYISPGYEVISQVFPNGVWQDFSGLEPFNYIYFPPAANQVSATWNMYLRVNGSSDSLTWKETFNPLIPVGFPMYDLTMYAVGGDYTLSLYLFRIPGPAVQFMGINK